MHDLVYVHLIKKNTGSLTDDDDGALDSSNKCPDRHRLDEIVAVLAMIIITIAVSGFSFTVYSDSKSSVAY